MFQSPRRWHWGIPAAVVLFAAAFALFRGGEQRPPRAELAFGEFKVRIDRAREQAAEGDWQAAANTVESIHTLGPENPATYSALDWELSYNIRLSTGDPDARYDCVRRGHLLMLDGLREFSNHPVILYHLAGSIHRTVGQVDDHEYLQDCFAADEPLHVRLEEFIELDRAQDRDGRVNNFLTARELYLAVQSDIEQSGFPEDWWEPPEFLIWLEAPTSQYVYLRTLAGSGPFDDEYVDAWQELDGMLDDYESNHYEAVQSFLRQHPDEPELSDPLFSRHSGARNAQWRYEFMRDRSVAEQSDLTIDARRMHLDLLPSVELFPEEDDPVPEDIQISAEDLSELIEAWKAVADAHPVMSDHIEQLLIQLEIVEDRIQEDH